MFKDKTELRKDGHKTLESGMNSGRDPTLLTPQECAFASNVTFRGGFPAHRQQFLQVPLTDLGSLAAFQAGLYQGATIYDIDDGQEYIMVMVGGALYQLSIAGSGLTVKQVFNDGTSNPNAPQCWFCQADIYMVIQDGTSTPIIMQGLSTIRRAGTTEVPVGQSMAYGQGRLWLAQNRQFVAGDILGGPTSVISFTEQTYLAEAGFFGVPLTSGTIIGMTFSEIGDTATGQGELLVFARSAAFSVLASVPREATATQPGWQGTAGMQKVTLTNIGGTGWRNLLNVNSDVFFRSKDGWRTYRTARNEQYGWGGAPISREMNRVLANDSLPLLDYASAALFKNRVLMTAEPLPYKNSASATFGCLVVLDLDVISSVINKSNLAYEFSPYFSNRGAPAYDGRWAMPDGYRILQVLSGTFAHVERCFIFALNTTTNKTEVWELSDSGEYDQGQNAIVCQIETKAFEFKLPDALKMLRRGDLYWNAVRGSTDVTVEYRSDGYMAWVLWDTFTITGQGTSQGSGAPPPSNLCNIPPCSVPGYCSPGPDPSNPYGGGYWFQKKLPTPNGACDPVVGKLLKNGFYFQLRITWKGPSTLIMLILHAEELVEDPNGGCP
jgi:hypothetical protein